jgi:hypothetical protein
MLSGKACLRWALVSTTTRSFGTASPCGSESGYLAEVNVPGDYRQGFETDGGGRAATGRRFFIAGLAALEGRSTQGETYDVAFCAHGVAERRQGCPPSRIRSRVQ